MRCGSIDADGPTPLGPANGIGDQSIAIVHIVNMNLLVLGDIRRVHQFVVDGNASFIMQLSVSDGCTMNLGFEQNSLHAFSKFYRYR